jgi:hypothetical protein
MCPVPSLATEPSSIGYGFGTPEDSTYTRSRWGSVSWLTVRFLRRYTVLFTRLADRTQLVPSHRGGLRRSSRSGFRGISE